MLPWKQMEAGADQFIDTIKIPVRDNGQVEGLVAGNFPLDVSVTNTDTIYNEIGSSFNTVLGQEINNYLDDNQIGRKFYKGFYKYIK